MRRVSCLTDPQDLVNVYGERMRELLGHDATISLSRRNLQSPWYRITRADSLGDIDPWRHTDRLPLFDRGVLGDLLYGDEPVILDDFSVDPSDPAASYLAGVRSLAAIPHYDNGVALNMVLLLARRPAAFDHDQLPQMTLQGNLFGRATNSLVLSRRLKEAYDIIDRELEIVSDIQRSLLPFEFPFIPSLKLSSDYQSSSRAGGDYFDFFPLGHGLYGILIADVSGHGTPAAVLMAIVHAIAHLVPGGPHPPEHVMDFINRQLAARYTSSNGSFVTAFYAVFDADNRTLRYANAGHPPPLRLRAAEASVHELPSTRAGLPLGIIAESQFEQDSVTLSPGDVLLFYTDGITEARAPSGEMYGGDRLKSALFRAGLEKHPVPVLLEDLRAFCGSAPAGDDRTMLVAQVR
ncbi:MAG: PP2C family protein-serine/threonine phosphatase [Phycisphaerales bacterium]|nr:PP2C family protein-serine/threonine phosphatase [Phycisphaerales bacterium]